MKKILVLIFVLAMSMLIFACGNDSDEPDFEEDSYSELTIWGIMSHNLLDILPVAVELYRRDNLSVDFTVARFDDIDARIAMHISAGTYDGLPDIMLLPNETFVKTVMNFPGVFRDLTGSGIRFDEFTPAKTSLSVIDGRNFGFPLDVSVSISVLRTDIIGAFDFTIDDFTNITWARFIELGQEILATTGMPMAATIAGSADLISDMIKSAGVSMFSADGSPNIVGNAVLRQAVETYAMLVQTGVLIEVNSHEAYLNAFTNDGIVVGAIGEHEILEDIRQRAAFDGLWAMTNIPRLDVPGGTNYSGSGGSSWAVLDNENYVQAIDFLKNTFGGNAELYDTLFEDAAVIGAWASVVDSPVFQSMDSFFAGQRIVADLIRFSENTPIFRYGNFHGEAISAIGVAVTNILGGADIDAELQAAQEFVQLQMQR